MKKFLLATSLLLISTAALAREVQEDPSIALATMGARLSNLEEENRKLSGKVDELQHQLEQAQAKAEAAKAAAPSPTQPIIVGQANADKPAPTSAADGSTVVKANPYVIKVTPPAAEDDGAISDEFDQVFKSVVAEDYKTAKPGLNNFIAKHPGSGLAGEAYFWLGEIAWSERDFSTAALNYGKGYKEAPTGEKAPENLLKMALTLKELGKKEEGCKYIDRFNNEFPDAHADLQKKATAARIDLGCK